MASCRHMPPGGVPTAHPHNPACPPDYGQLGKGGGGGVGGVGGGVD